jgi:hypothetical protein
VDVDFVQRAARAHGKAVGRPRRVFRRDPLTLIAGAAKEQDVARRSQLPRTPFLETKKKWGQVWPSPFNQFRFRPDAGGLGQIPAAGAARDRTVARQGVGLFWWLSQIDLNFCHVGDAQKLRQHLYQVLDSV